MPGKSRTNRNRRVRIKLDVDPAILHAASAAAKKAGGERYGRQLDGAFDELKTFLAGRKPSDLTGKDAVKYLSLHARFDGLAIEQKHFCEAELARLLGLYPDDGSELVSA